jgi:hypothetical protein
MSTLGDWISVEYKKQKKVYITGPKLKIQMVPEIRQAKPHTEHQITCNGACAFAWRGTCKNNENCKLSHANYEDSREAYLNFMQHKADIAKPIEEIQFDFVCMYDWMEGGCKRHRDGMCGFLHSDEMYDLHTASSIKYKGKLERLSDQEIFQQYCVYLQYNYTTQSPVDNNIESSPDIQEDKEKEADKHWPRLPKKNITKDTTATATEDDIAKESSTEVSVAEEAINIETSTSDIAEDVGKEINIENETESTEDNLFVVKLTDFRAKNDEEKTKLKIKHAEERKKLRDSQLNEFYSMIEEDKDIVTVKFMKKKEEQEKVLAELIEKQKNEEEELTNSLKSILSSLLGR